MQKHLHKQINTERSESCPRRFENQHSDSWDSKGQKYFIREWSPKDELICETRKKNVKESNLTGNWIKWKDKSDEENMQREGRKMPPGGEGSEGSSLVRGADPEKGEVREVAVAPSPMTTGLGCREGWRRRALKVYKEGGEALTLFSVQRDRRQGADGADYPPFFFITGPGAEGADSLMGFYKIGARC